MNNKLKIDRIVYVYLNRKRSESEFYAWLYGSLNILNKMFKKLYNILIITTKFTNFVIRNKKKIFINN